ncbi:hypothetical protein DM2_1902 [Halorubrum sp. DM2]|uniref:DoxX family protein n=1 Tax=Halorubrum sp. DM2 TaxID=2527867 RepID=UPI0024B80936|nr:DoxX family membrane protein [Halorubrum sp. DM2]VTT85864.1 hypothetical protein DM2_1902 [Halorubrum sp. DM2]
MTDDETDSDPEADSDDPDRSLAPLMGATYVAAGIAHFLAPKRFAAAIPPSFPRPVGLVYLSGIAEVVLGAGVALRRTRRPSAWGIVALLVAVFPANVHLARSDVLNDLVPERFADIARLAAWVRLPFQAVLIGWALRYARSEETSMSEAEPDPSMSEAEPDRA